MPMPGWDDILLLGNQLNPPPLNDHDAVDTTTVIGRNAKKPLILANPIFVSHMSFGALSKETKVALAKGSALAGAAMCSGEGGILPEEMAAAHKYIFEYIPNLYSVTRENLRNADAIEIKIGQGTKPGIGICVTIAPMIDLPFTAISWISSIYRQLASQRAYADADAGLG